MENPNKGELKVPSAPGLSSFMEDSMENPNKGELKVP
jgi:hypothetical protein